MACLVFHQLLSLQHLALVLRHQLRLVNIETIEARYPFLWQPTCRPQEELPALHSYLLPWRHIRLLLFIFVVSDALELVFFRGDVKERPHEEYDHQQVEIVCINDYH